MDRPSRVADRIPHAVKQLRLEVARAKAALARAKEDEAGTAAEHASRLAWGRLPYVTWLEGHAGSPRCGWT